jgi:hypothetical protein
MKLKRMALVAAAAVVGPTVLMATPAMADEVQNPAVTTPDAEPKDDPAAPAAEQGADAAKPEAAKPDAPAVTPPVVTPPVVTPPVAPQPPAQPSAEQPATGESGAEEPGDEEHIATGPKMTLSGVPSSFTAGADWQQFALTVDNTGGGELKDYALGLNLFTHTLQYKGEYIAMEAYLPNETGTWGWYPVEAYGSEESYGLYIANVSIEKNEKFDLQLRLKFTKDSPATTFGLWTVGWSDVEGEEIFSESTGARSEIVKATDNGGSTGGNTGGQTGGNTGGQTGGGNTGGSTGGNDTKPNGGAKPIVDQTGTTTTGTGTGTGTATAPGGQLAETGSDAATAWALGASGVALAMGGAFVAGTGRRRRPTA